jgi:Bacterial alpha-L-rhamnosidase 6 hairpin glycosidase domain
LLPSLGADGRRPAFCGARSLRLRQRQAAPRRDARGLAEDGAQDPLQQRGVLPPLPSGVGGHGGAAPVLQRHRPYGVSARSGPPLVRGPVWSRQPHRVYPEPSDLSGVRPSALETLGSLQAKERDDYRDAETGKILHEIRYGELAHFKLIPHTPYYGTADATPLYLITLHETWRATGDRRLLEQHLETAEGCLSWIDNYGDRDGDGFQEYQTRSPLGYENMGWKDSGDAVVYPDGSLVKGPKALCELQGYVYGAWLGMAEICNELGRHDRARELRAKAADLFQRFNDVFWDDDLGFYAYALDGDKGKVLTVASNPGHCLWSGIVPPERAAKVVERLMAPDMWSPWAIRTLSSRHPAFNHTLSDWIHLAARQCHHCRRLQALRVRRGGGTDCPRDQRGRKPLPVQPAPGALYQHGGAA